MTKEYFEVSLEAAAALERVRRTGGRIVAVGTTVVRAIESSLDSAGRPIASRGWTDLVVEPEQGLRLVDGVLNGSHEVKASHLELLAAITGRRRLDRAYRAALEAGYLWHEFGDVHLILSD